MKTRTVVAAAVVVGLVSSFHLPAQETAAERHQMATNQLKQLAATLSSQCLSDVRTLEDWTQQRAERRRQLLEMLGLDPLPARTPLKAQITGQLEHDAYRIEKIVFQSMPGLYVTGNFYVSKDSAMPSPAILYLCGHSPHRFGAKVNYENRGTWFVSHGYSCLVLDTLEFGEVAGIHHGTQNLNMWNWLSLGYTPAGVEVWNAMRALDYLETRPEVDKKRIGLTGGSGGGATTWYTTAVDERVGAAVPVCSTFTFGSQAAHWIASGQCDCIYYPNSYLWDFPMVGALIAPRPLLIISGQQDTIFPPDGYHEVYRRTKRIYDLYSAGDSERIREVDDNVGHGDPPLFLREARQWMQHWLKSDSTPLVVETNSPPKENAADLTCLPGLPTNAVNYRIQNQFTVLAHPTEPDSPAAWERRRADVVAGLKEKVFRWFPQQEIAFQTRMTQRGGGYLPAYADFKEVSFQTEERARIRAMLLTPKNRRTTAPVLIYVKRPGDSIYLADTDELLPLLGRYTILILNPRFTEQSLSAAEYANIERTAVWVGRTIGAMQVWDILRTIKWVTDEEKLPTAALSLYGKGDMGILALYAALFDDRVQQVILNDPPASHWQHPALLNALRVTDIPEVAGAFAPRRLISLTKLPAEFDRALRIYRLQSRPDQFLQAGSLPEALEAWNVPNGSLAAPGHSDPAR